MATAVGPALGEPGHVVRMDGGIVGDRACPAPDRVRCRRTSGRWRAGSRRTRRSSRRSTGWLRPVRGIGDRRARPVSLHDPRIGRAVRGGRFWHGSSNGYAPQAARSDGERPRPYCSSRSLTRAGACFPVTRCNGMPNPGGDFREPGYTPSPRPTTTPTPREPPHARRAGRSPGDPPGWHRHPLRHARTDGLRARRDPAQRAPPGRPSNSRARRPHWGFVIEGELTFVDRRSPPEDPGRSRVPRPCGRRGTPFRVGRARARRGLPAGRTRPKT